MRAPSGPTGDPGAEHEPVDNTPLSAVILIIGDELLAGEIPDRNGPWLAQALAAEGLRVREIRVLPDSMDTIGDALLAALGTSRVVIACGGLGPTSDDLTTDAVARALGLRTRRDPAAWAAIQALFAALGISPIPPGNEKQALFPHGAEVLPNDRGTAPGFLLSTEGGSLVSVLPGPPRENRAMFTQEFLPRLRQRFASSARWETIVLRVFGLPESTVGERMRPVERAHPAIRVGYQARYPEILVKLRHGTQDGEEARIAAEAVRAAMAPFLYGEGEAALPEVLGRRAAGKGLRLVTAESCTAGWAAKLLTDIPGSSAWMEEGYVTYSNAAKTALVGVPADLIEEHGAVSEPVARAMLAGALERSGGRAQAGVAITGIAGPEGGTAQKPVGTVCLAWGSLEDLHCRTHRFHFDRDRNRLLSAWSALGHLLRWLGD